MCPSQIPHQQNIHGHKAAPVWGSCRENLLGSAKTAWEASVREGYGADLGEGSRCISHVEEREEKLEETREACAKALW